MSTETLSMSVENTGFLVDRMGQDCGPLQYVRELTQNSIEAIMKLPDKKGEITWDIDSTIEEFGGKVRKLCIIDNGIGMTGEEQLQFINKLSSSDNEQSVHKNFGVGAKIAGVTRNHLGLIYLSWKDGEGAMLHLWRDPASNNYGAKRFPAGDGEYLHYLTLKDEAKPPLISKHGTKVVLLGNSEADDTFEPPKNAKVKLPSKWIRRYLNSRYYTFPEGITIRAREGDIDSATGNTALRVVTGQREYLERNSVQKGKVELEGATAYWWILDSDLKTLQANFGHYASTRHVAALYQNELYELVEGPAATAKLQLFGVILGYERVVLYVEPETFSGRVSANTARTELLLDSEPLPWAEWAATFRKNMPVEIKQLIEDRVDLSSGSDHQAAIKDRLKKLKELFEISKYRPSASGEHSVEDFDSAGGKPTKENKPSTGDGTTGGEGGTTGSLYAMFAKTGDKPAEQVPTDNIPEVRWISVKKGTRQPDELEDRAARYIETANEIHMNADFRVFADMTDRWAKKYGLTPEIRGVVEEVVFEWFGQQVVESVMGLLTIKNSAKWNIEQVRSAWSEEALTACVMSRYHVDLVISRSLGQKLGSLKDLDIDN